jgi:hypothetical protein
VEPLGIKEIRFIMRGQPDVATRTSKETTGYSIMLGMNEFYGQNSTQKKFSKKSRIP